MTLVELLVGMIIMAIVSTMLYLTWFSLNSSSAYSVNSNEARDNARLAMTRMVNELRDAQGMTSNGIGYPPIQSAALNCVVFSTTYNETGNDDQSMPPRLVMYQYLPASGEIVRTVDSNNDGVLTDDQPQVILRNVVNSSQSVTMFGTNYSQAPVFIYSYYDANGTLTHTSDLTGITTPNNVVDITIRLFVDLNPGKSPVYMDLQCTVEPRNSRWGA
jgi:type II secretory pathway pseudopilin PulG